MAGNPNHGKDGRFSSGSGGGTLRSTYNAGREPVSGVSGNALRDNANRRAVSEDKYKKAVGHNAGGGNRAVADHTAQQHKSQQASGSPKGALTSYKPTGAPGSLEHRRTSLYLAHEVKVNAIAKSGKGAERISKLTDKYISAYKKIK